MKTGSMGIAIRAALAVVVLALALTAAPQAAQAGPGNVAFLINSWSTDPVELVRGREFDLTLTYTNSGTHGASDVIVQIGSAGSFVGINTSQPVGWVAPGGVQTVTVRGAVSNSITTGYYAMPIQFSYIDYDQSAMRTTEQGSIGVHVTGLAVSSGQDTGRPQLVIDRADVAPGQQEGEVLVTLRLRNTGNRTATGIIVTMGRSEVLDPPNGSAAFPVEGTISGDEALDVSLALELLKAPGERLTQDFTVEYSSPAGGSYQANQTVSLEFSGMLDQSPRLLIESAVTEPLTVTPGSRLRLIVQLANVGGGEARQVFVRLGQNASTLGPLAPVGGGNVRYVDALAGGARAEVTFDLAVDGGAEAKLVPIDVTLEYADAFGATRTDTVAIGLQVVASPHFQIGLFEPVTGLLYPGDTFDLPIEVINIGRRLVNVSTVEVTSADLEITGGSMYVGPLDGGTSGTLIATATALDPGTATVTVTVNYLDEFQQEQTITRTLTFEIEQPQEPGGTDSPTSDDEGELTFWQRVWRAILGFFGLGTNEAGAAGSAGPTIRRAGPRG